MRLLKAFKESGLQTKIFWTVSLGLGIVTTALCLYPYLWFDQHRSGVLDPKEPQVSPIDQKIREKSD